MTSGPIVIGPRPALAGSVLSYSVPKETQAIYVQNYSKLTLLVSFAATAPTATDSLNNQYDGVLAPGGRDTFYVQSRGASSAERSLNAMGAFTGNVWIMPVDRTANQANTGTISTMNDVWLSAYGPYDPPPPFPGGLPLSIDLSSQPRVVAVPIGLSHWVQGNWDATGIQVMATFTPTAAQLAVGRAPIYLYYAQLSTGIGSGTSTMGFTIEVQWRTSGGGAVGAPFVLARGTIWHTTAQGSFWTFAPSWPLGYFGGQGGNIPPTAARADVQLDPVSGACGADFTCAFFMDPSNLIGNADIGVEAVLPTTPTLPLF